MSEGNPNQGFDNYAKEFSLRIEALRAWGEYQKHVAEANLENAKALEQLERTRTTAQINQALRRTLREIEIAEHKSEVQKNSAERRTTELQDIIAGGKPIGLASFYARLAAIEWVASRGVGSVLFAKFPAEARGQENFVSVSIADPDVEELPDAVDNLAQVIVWMRRHLNYFAAGSALHQFFAERVAELAEVQLRIVANLQEALDAARAGEYAKLTALKPFLEIK